MSRHRYCSVDTKSRNRTIWNQFWRSLEKIRCRWRGSWIRTR